jgi:hypothetical protein
MKLGTIFGALAGSAIDRADGDDSTLDGALIGAGVATAVRIIAPIAITFATGWLVLRGLNALTDKVLGEHSPEY